MDGDSDHPAAYHLQPGSGLYLQQGKFTDVLCFILQLHSDIGAFLHNLNLLHIDLKRRIQLWTNMKHTFM